jgi:hypothetical protein
VRRCAASPELAKACLSLTGPSQRELLSAQGASNRWRRKLPAGPRLCATAPAAAGWTQDACRNPPVRRALDLLCPACRQARSGRRLSVHAPRASSERNGRSP